MLKAKKLSICGRSFKVPEETTMWCDTWNQGLIGRAGLDKLHMIIGESADQFAVKILRNLATDSDVFLLLGGLLLPENLSPTEWTPKVAKETAKHLRQCNAPDDKKLIQSEIAELIMGFLAAELSSVMLTPKSGVQHFAESAVISPQEPEYVDGATSETGHTSYKR